MARALEKAMIDYGRARLTGSASSYDLALLEHKIWKLVKQRHGARVTKKVGERRDWMSKEFGGSTSTYDQRAKIFNAGKWAHVLFEKMDKDNMPLIHASEIVTHIKEGLKLDPSGKPKVLLEQVLESYTGQYKDIRAVQWVTQPRSKRPADRKKGRRGIGPKSPEAVSLGIRSRKYKEDVKALTKEFLDASLATLDHTDPYLRDKIIESFNLSIDQTVEEFRYELDTLKKETRLGFKSIHQVGKRRFDVACEVLQLHDAAYGKPIDMKKVARRMRIRARDLHPDRNPTPEAKEEYQAVTDAFKTLQDYARSMNGRNNGPDTAK
jgi:hypothetical protein